MVIVLGQLNNFDNKKIEKFMHRFIFFKTQKLLMSSFKKFSGHYWTTFKVIFAEISAVRYNQVLGRVQKCRGHAQTEWVALKIQQIDAAVVHYISVIASIFLVIVRSQQLSSKRAMRIPLHPVPEYVTSLPLMSKSYIETIVFKEI